MAWIFVLGDRDAATWVLANSRIALAGQRRTTVARMASGDRIGLYVTTRASPDHVGQLVAIGSLAATPTLDPVTLVGRPFAFQAPLRLDQVLPPGQGLPIAPLVDELGFVKNKTAWRFNFFNAISCVPEEDMDLLIRRFNEL